MGICERGGVWNRGMRGGGDCVLLIIFAGMALRECEACLFDVWHEDECDRS